MMTGPNDQLVNAFYLLLLIGGYSALYAVLGLIAVAIDKLTNRRQR